MCISSFDNRFENITLQVGSGKNNFTMSRGSFKYNQKIWNKKKLNLVETKKLSDSKTELIFADSNKSLQCSLFIEEKDGFTYVKMSDNLPSQINRYWVTFPSILGEHIYGCGETYSKFDLSGEKVRIWVAEHQNVKRIARKVITEKITGPRPHHVRKFSNYESYYAQPTFVSSEKYFVHVFTNAYSEFDFRKKNTTTLYLQEKPDFILGSADSFTELSEKLATVLGKQKAIPDWLYDGSILAIQQGNKVIDEKLAAAKKAGVKVNGVWSQDWCGCRRTGFGYQVMWNWQSDEENQYPALKEKIAEWKEQGVRFLGYINPFIALEKNLYKTASEKGYCVKDKDGKDYLVTITTFPAAMIDLTNPEAYEWYKNLIKENMIGIGMGGWMADFGEYLPVDAVLFDGSDPSVIHNQWPAIWAKLNQEAIKECGKEDDVFFFTRAGHTGTISASTMMWTGDQHVDWSIDDGIGSVIPATLSLAMSGYGITHSDVGGYTTIQQMRRSKELLMRWEEMNVFSPLWRSHEGNQPVNDVQFDADEELLAHLARCSKMHVALKDYLKSLVAETEAKGTPVMRPIFYHFDENWAYTEKTEYLLGKDVLVCPVLDKGVASRKCHLPQDKWINIFTNQEYDGGIYDIKSEIGNPPVFVRKDSNWKEILLQVGNIK